MLVVLGEGEGWSFGYFKVSLYVGFGQGLN